MPIWSNYGDRAIIDVDYATLAALPACTYSNGSGGVGSKLTGNANGALAAIDGITPAAGDVVLVNQQAAGLQKQLAELNHKADNISFAANECPYIGLLGAITGIYFFMTGSGGLGGALDPSHFKEIMSNSLVGLGIAFIPTITGVFFRSVLSWQHHLIAHEVTYVLKGY